MSWLLLLFMALALLGALTLATFVVVLVWLAAGYFADGPDEHADYMKREG